MNERREGGQPANKRKTPPPLRNPKSCILPSFLLVVQQTCKAKLIFFVAKHGNLRISRTVRFILPFLFSLYDEYVCSPMPKLIYIIFIHAYTFFYFFIFFYFFLFFCFFYLFFQAGPSSTHMGWAGPSQPSPVTGPSQ